MNFEKIDAHINLFFNNETTNPRFTEEERYDIKEYIKTQIDKEDLEDRLSYYAITLSYAKHYSVIHDCIYLLNIIFERHAEII